MGEEAAALCGGFLVAVPCDRLFHLCREGLLQAVRTPGVRAERDDRHPKEDPITQSESQSSNVSCTHALSMNSARFEDRYYQLRGAARCRRSHSSSRRFFFSIQTKVGMGGAAARRN